MIKKSVMWMWVFVFLVVGSVWLMFTPNPEEISAISSDGVVTVTGVAKESAPLRVVTVTDARPMIASNGRSFGQSYLVTPNLTALPRPAVLTWQLHNLPVADSEIAVYRFNEDSLMWDLVLPVMSYDEDILTVETSTLGVFSLGKKEAVTVPEFAAVYEDILASKPEGAVGFVTMVGYAREGESIIKLPSVGQQGGCGGAVNPGVSEQKSTVTRDVMLLVDDVQTKISLTFFTRWFIADGCYSDAAFQSSTDYGTLPLSN